MSFRVVVILALATSLASCKSGEKSSSDSEQNSDTSSTSALSNGTATMADFDGEATNAELQIMLDNSELSCSSGDILSYDGENWSCSSTITNFQSTGITDDATSEAVTIDENGNVGIGSPTPIAALHVNASSTTGSEEVLRVTVADSPASYFKIGNGTVANGSFIPSLRGHSGESEIGLGLIASTDDDTGTKPISIISAKNIVAGSGAPVLTRPLLQIRNHNTTVTSFSANGNVGIGTTSPARKLHISDAMRLEPISSPPSSPTSGDIYFDDSEAVCMYVNGAWRLIEDGGSGGTCS